ncbi:MAG: hypothetical protein NVS1B14_01600 [Vulcanimicrobiaceae bacterium]
MIRRSIAIGAFCLWGITGVSRAAELPQVLAPPAPFPKVLTTALAVETVAPGIQYAQYDVTTRDGPLVVHVVKVGVQRADVRVDTVLANDVLRSTGETTASMAARTGAVAGINGDYFDIGNTNEPFGIVVRSGHLLRTPNVHGAFALTRDKRVSISPISFAATATIGSAELPLQNVNVWPPPGGGLALLTPEFGAVPVTPGITVISLAPLDISPSQMGRYRVTETQPAQTHREYALAMSTDAVDQAGTPQPGDVITLRQQDESLAGVRAAMGGGPMLLRNGTRVEERDAPAAAEGRTRIPISAAARGGDGALLLVQVDGREPFHSIGLSRPEFTSLVIALGAQDAVSFDGGGSSAIVARRPGDRNAVLRNEPSDGSERRVGDGLFVFSDAPVGPPSNLVVRPPAIRALTGASVRLWTAVTDAAEHPISVPALGLQFAISPPGLGEVRADVFTAYRPGSGVLHVRRGTTRADIPLEVVDRVARIVVRPDRVNLETGKSVQLFAQAYDTHGFAIALPPRLPWRAQTGTIRDDGTFVAGERDSVVSVRLGDAVASQRITVGQHDAEFQMGGSWRFTSTPPNNPGAVTFGVPCANCISLDYDFTGAERGATMLGDRPLPTGALGLRLEINGDGNGEILRISLLNAINERVYLSVGPITWRGWQTREVLFPESLATPARLRSLYVLNALKTRPVRSAGSVAIRNVRVILAGATPRPAPGALPPSPK